MVSYEESRTIPGPFASPAPLESVVEFYRINGYELRDMNENPDEGSPEAVLERGETSDGWWSSNTARLPSRVRVTLKADQLELRYQVDQPGQPLTENDRKFWKREMRAAANQARNPNRRPVDLRHEAAVRAEHLRRRILSYGIWILIYLLGFVVVVKLFTDAGGS